MEHNHPSARRANDELRAARVAHVSPTTGHALSRSELADLVRGWVLGHLGEHSPFDEVHLGKLERGEIRWPAERYRSALRQLLGAPTDAALGFRRDDGCATLGDVDRREFIGSAAAFVVSPRQPDLNRTSAGVGTSLLGATEFDRLRLATGRATRMERASQFAALDAVLPGLLDDVERMSYEAPPTRQHDVLALLSQAHALQAWLFIKLDRTSDAQVAAGSALGVAQRADAAILIGAALRCLSETHLRAGLFNLACDLAVEAAEFVGRAGVVGHDALAIQGAGYLSAAVACARQGDDSGASEMLEAATACGRQLGTDVADVAVFGPSNVDIHEVAIAVELGDPITALQRAERVEPDLPQGLGERRGRYLIDVARAYAARGQDDDATRSLLRAETAAPEEVHTHRLTRSLLSELLDRERRDRTPQLRALAERCGVIGSA